MLDAQFVLFTLQSFCITVLFSPFASSDTTAEPRSVTLCYSFVFLTAQRLSPKSRSPKNHALMITGNMGTVTMSASAYVI